MKAVMISIRPKWVDKIASGKKTIEVRKSRPKIDTPFKCYIYATKNRDCVFERNGKVYDYKNANGKVIGEFVCDYIVKYVPISIAGKGYIGYYIPIDTDKDCLSEEYRLKYGKGKYLYGWHISDLKIYDKPREIWEFMKPCTFEAGCHLCDKSGYAPDMDLDCYNNVERPPQSWFYIEV